MKFLMVPALCLLMLAGCASTPQRDLAFERLEASLGSLDNDVSLSELAAAERLQARHAVQALRQADKKSRPARLYVAERRVEIARVAAQVELARQQSARLERERDRILLEATRRDAEKNRLEAEKLRLQSLARAEEAASLSLCESSGRTGRSKRSSASK